MAGGVLLAEEVRLVLGHGTRDFAVLDGGVEVRASHDGREVMPVPRIPLAADPALGAVDVRGCARRPNSDHPCRLNFDQGWKDVSSETCCG